MLRYLSLTLLCLQISLCVAHLLLEIFSYSHEILVIPKLFTENALAVKEYFCFVQDLIPPFFLSLSFFRSPLYGSLSFHSSSFHSHPSYALSLSVVFYSHFLNPSLSFLLHRFTQKKSTPSFDRIDLLFITLTAFFKFVFTFVYGLPLFIRHKSLKTTLLAKLSSKQKNDERVVGSVSWWGGDWACTKFLCDRLVN